ncbi:MAG: RNase adapter RapZ [Oscillospiraceae bacterium]|nr:RNase adapter RapZ [Oscillospiraceae bacterium]
MEFIIVTGQSGAGKSQVAAALEDMGVYCVDNMPVALLPQLANIFLNMQEKYSRVALVTDIRAWGDANELLFALDELRNQGIQYRILYLYADIQTLVKRYKETRRRHPLETNTVSLEAAIRRESHVLEPIRLQAEDVLNTSGLTIAQLKSKLSDIFGGFAEKRGISVNVISFGFKYGVPIEADMVFDVRFLPNPYYEEDLRHKTGLDDPVHDYVFRDGNAAEFLTKLVDMLMFLIPLYEKEGKYSLTVGIGCTGGQHRSVSIARALTEYLKQHDIPVRIEHRNIDGDTKVR